MTGPKPHTFDSEKVGRYTVILQCISLHDKVELQGDLFQTMTGNVML